MKLDEVIKCGTNIAIKDPLHKWDETVAFYRERVGLEVKKTPCRQHRIFLRPHDVVDRQSRTAELDGRLEAAVDG